MATRPFQNPNFDIPPAIKAPISIGLILWLAVNIN